MERATGSGAPVRLWNWAILSASDDIAEKSQSLVSKLAVCNVGDVRHHTVRVEIVTFIWRSTPLRTAFRDDQTGSVFSVRKCLQGPNEQCYGY